jgi:IclR family transcriptional regulator, KDG regulon repressor
MKTPRTTSDRYIVEAVSRALDVLEVFNHSEELTLKEVINRADLNKSRGFRLLYTLAERGYVERNLDGTRYRLGVRLFERAAQLRRDVKQVAQPYMQQLHLRFNETVNLGVIHQGDVLYVDLLESSRPIRMSAMVGSRMPIASTSLGKAMLAFTPGGGNGLVSGSRALQRELEVVRRCGYAQDLEENEPGIECVGAPIRDLTGNAVAAMSVSGPVARISANRRQIAAALVAMCAEISRQLGFGGIVSTPAVEKPKKVRAARASH